MIGPTLTSAVRALLGLGGGMFLAEPIAAAPRTEARPNVILILADDLGYGSLGCYGGAAVSTPHLDRLAAAGMRFTDFHSNGAMCTPTRAALMTGRYPQRCAWVDDAELSPVFREQRAKNPAQRWAWGLSLAEVTLAKVLRPAGYRTGLVGKWHLGYDAKFHPMNQGFDEFFGYVGGAVDYHTHEATHGVGGLDWWNGRQVQDEPGYSMDLLTRSAADFIARHRARPFFLYLAFPAPHLPWQGRDRAKRESPAETYREMIAILDESVGAVVESVRRHGLEEKTLLIFCSDNGAEAPRSFPANGHLKGRKGSMDEGGHRVPFIARWPGVVPAGVVNPAPVMTMDLFPTVANLAGASMPAGHGLDGVDLLPLLKNESPGINRDLHWMFGESWAVRQGAWKLSGQGEKPLALVNLEADLAEKANQLAAEPELGERLWRLHREWTAAVGSR